MDKAERNKLIVEMDAPAKEVAEQFGVSVSTVYRVWKDAAMQKANAAEVESFAVTPTGKRLNRGQLFGQTATSGITRVGGNIEQDYQRELRGDGGIKLYEQMANHPVAAAVLFASKMAIRSVNWYVEAAGEDKVDEDAAEFVDGCLHDMAQTLEEIIDQICTMLIYGYSIAEIVYKRRKGRDVSKSQPRSRFDDNKIGWRRWQFIHPRSLSTYERWDFDDFGRVQGFWQTDQDNYFERVYIPIEKALLFRTTSAFDNPEGRSVLRPMYTAHYYAENLAEVEAISAERMGAGLPVMYVDSSILGDVNDDESNYALAKDLVTNVRVDEQMGVVIPARKMGTGSDGAPGMLFELMSAPSQGVNFTDIIDRHEKRMAMTVLAQFIFLGMLQVGTQALNASATDTFQMSIGAWADSIAGVVNMYAIPRLLALNTFTIEDTPKLMHSDIGVPDLPALAEYVNKLVGSQVLTPDGSLEEHLREMAKLPEQDEEIEIVAEQPTPPTPEAPPEEEEPDEEVEISADPFELDESFGGPESGHRGHKGVPGQRGGSAPRFGVIGSYLSGGLEEEVDSTASVLQEKHTELTRPRARELAAAKIFDQYTKEAEDLENTATARDASPEHIALYDRWMDALDTQTIQDKLIELTGHRHLIADLTVIDQYAELFGGPGSGHHGHKGVPGSRGGSAPSGGGVSFTQAATSGDVASSEGLGGGICKSSLVHYEGDGSGVWKAETDASGYHDGNSEVAAYRINQMLGDDSVPETVFSELDGQRGSSQIFIDGAKEGWDITGGNTSSMEYLNKNHAAQMDGIIATDIITYNADRHEGNWIVDSGGKLWAIDNGHAQWQKWEDSNHAAAWNSSLFDKQQHGSYKFSDESIAKWSKITRQEFDAALMDVSTDFNVRKENAWANLQYIVREGKIEW